MNGAKGMNGVKGPNSVNGHGPGMPTAVEEHGPLCLPGGELRRLLARSRWHRLVVLGDSPTERAPEAVPGYRSEPWYDQVAAALRTADPDLACLNLLGKHRSTIGEVRSRQLAGALVFRGDLAVVGCGVSDLLRTPFNPHAVEVELDRVVAPLRDVGYDVLLLGPFDLSRSQGLPQRLRASSGTRQRVLADRARTAAFRHGALFLDLSALSPAVAGDAVWSADLRLNSRGHAIAAAAVVRKLGSYLAGAGTGLLGRELPPQP
jgi:hypothetical protein